MGSKCLISRLEARQAQASPCHPLLVSPPRSGMPVPPAEITRERFPRYPGDTRCVAARDLQPCVTDSGLVRLHQHRENEALPVAHSQQAPRQSAGIHPGSTEPEEGPGSGLQRGQGAGGRAVRSPSANGTWVAPVPLLPWAGTHVSPPEDPSREVERRCPSPFTRGGKAGGPRAGMQPGPATQPRPGPGTARAQPLSARRGPTPRSWGHRATRGPQPLPQCPTTSPGTSCGGTERPRCRPQGRGA